MNSAVPINHLNYAKEMQKQAEFVVENRVEISHGCC